MAGDPKLYESKRIKKNGEIAVYTILSRSVAKPPKEKHPWVVNIPEIERRLAAGETKVSVFAEFGVKAGKTYDKYKKKWLNGELGITQVSQVANEEPAAL